MTKKRRSSIFRRKVNTRDVFQRFLIVCEGRKTEPNYFEGFRVNKKIHIEVQGTGYNTVSLVKTALTLKKDGDFDQVWCVFDKDSFSVEQVNEAFDLAGQKGIRIAFSNEAFEIWYLLHFDYVDSALSRRNYSKKLSSRLGFEYKKNMPNMYAILENILDEAIRNAARLMEQYKPYCPGCHNPSTTVHHLVQELRKHIHR
jgi:hypothetical protein